MPAVEGRQKRVLRKSQPAPETVAPPVDPKPVVKRVVRPRPNEEPQFECLECGTPFPKNAERCPKCKVRYVQEESDTGPAGIQTSSSEDTQPHISNDLPWIRFDSQTGSIEHTDGGPGITEVGIECANCGALVDFDIDKCPICGSEFQDADKGMISLFDNMEFDEDDEGEIDCPLCGAKVVLDHGRCPRCEAIVGESDPQAPDSKVEPVLRNENVVFVHLDVEQGEMNCLKRLARRLKFEPLTIKIDAVGRGGPGFEAVQRG